MNSVLSNRYLFKNSRIHKVLRLEQHSQIRVFAKQHTIKTNAIMTEKLKQRTENGPFPTLNCGKEILKSTDDDR